MCGVLGIYAPYDVYDELLYGLNTLQHRGQDNAGIVLYDKEFHIQKGRGLANFVFHNAEFKPGHMGLAHIRYATQGDTSLLNAQPFVSKKPLEMAMIHNGNVTNFEELKKYYFETNGQGMETTNDIELMLNVFSNALWDQSPLTYSPQQIFAAVKKTQMKVEGAYAAVVMIPGYGMLAFNDPNNIRPLILGVKINEGEESSYIFASESTCLDYLGYQKIYTLEGGQAVFVDKDMKLHFYNGIKRRKAFCVFEFIYFAREDSQFFERLVATERERMGRALAKHFRKAHLKPDIIIDVPSSAYFCARGIADELGVPYQKGLVKNHYIGRSFISPNQVARDNLVKQKLNAVRLLVEGRKVAVVDDSIVRGTTSKHIVSMLRERGAREVYFVSASPPLKHPCIYGIDISRKNEIIASTRSIEDIRQYIGADALIYPTLDDLHSLFSPSSHCDACFSGNYPTHVSAETFTLFALEKQAAGR
jgi:amidophosphoribosyltransferase